MADTIGYNDIGRMIRSAADKIRANRAELSKLDSAIGDGDHGMTIARAMGIAEKVITESEKKELKGLLKEGANLLTAHRIPWVRFVGSFDAVTIPPNHATRGTGDWLNLTR